MTEIDILWDTVEFFSRLRKLNWADYEIYKGRLRKLIPEDDEYQAAVKRLAEVMGL